MLDRMRKGWYKSRVCCLSWEASQHLISGAFDIVFVEVERGEEGRVARKREHRHRDEHARRVLATHAEDDFVPATASWDEATPYTGLDWS